MIQRQDMQKRKKKTRLANRHNHTYKHSASRTGRCGSSTAISNGMTLRNEEIVCVANLLHTLQEHQVKCSVRSSDSFAGRSFVPSMCRRACFRICLRFSQHTHAPEGETNAPEEEKPQYTQYSFEDFWIRLYHRIAAC